MDVVILIVAAALSVLLFQYGLDIWWIVPAVTGHFFLFCNVFLVWRRWELMWAGWFTAVVFWHMSAGRLSWYPSLLYVLPVTISVIVMQLRSPWYHGIWARRLNPRLDDFLHKKLS